MASHLVNIRLSLIVVYPHQWWENGYTLTRQIAPLTTQALASCHLRFSQRRVVGVPTSHFGVPSCPGLVIPSSLANEGGIPPAARSAERDSASSPLIANGILYISINGVLNTVMQLGRDGLFEYVDELHLPVDRTGRQFLRHGFRGTEWCSSPIRAVSKPTMPRDRRTARVPRRSAPGSGQALRHFRQFQEFPAPTGLTGDL